jgi:protein involved in polysaccharide export with SLBB domain
MASIIWGLAVESDRELPENIDEVEAKHTLDDTPTWHHRTTRLPYFAANLVLIQPEMDEEAHPDGGTSATAQLPPSVPASYRLTPGDQIRIVTWGGPTLNEVLFVDNAGQLPLPGFGVVPVSGLTRLEAQEAATKLLQEHIKAAGCVLSLETASQQRITVIGGVHNPGTWNIPAYGSILDALAAAGGLNETGTFRAIRWQGADGETTILDLYQLALGTDLSGLDPLQNGTVIVVPPPGPQVQVFGAVKRSFTFEVGIEGTLLEVLELAGGASSFGDTERIRLLRETPNGQELSMLTLAQLGTITVQDGDRLYIPEHAELDERFAAVVVEGAVRSPGTYPLRPDATVLDAIAMAGGLLPTADQEQATILRQLPQPVKLALNDDTTIDVYEDLVTDLKPETPLQARDRIVVPERPTLDDTTLQVSISGAVRRPDTYPLVPGMTVGDVLRLAGGITAQAQVDVADLVRVSEDGSSRTVERSNVDLRPILNKEADGPVLSNGDAIVVRSRNDDRIQLTVEGEVENNGVFVLPAGTTLGQALEIAGGLTKWAFPRGTHFFRASEAAIAQEQLELLQQQVSESKSINEQKLNSANDQRGRIALQQTILNQELELAKMQRAQATGRMSGIDIPGILSGVEGADFQLQDGDRIVVPKYPGTIRVLGQIMTPGSIRFEEGLKVRDAIARSGGLTQQSDEDRIFVIRANGVVVASAAYTGTAWDPETKKWVRTNLKKIILQEGDAVLVPPDLRYRMSGLELAKDLSQILFQVAATVGTIAVIDN